LTEFTQEFTVIFEIDSENFGNGKDVLAVRDRIKDFMAKMFAKLNNLLGMARGTKPASPA